MIMIAKLLKAVSNIFFVTVFFLLFFITGIVSADSSLVKLEDQLNDLVYNTSRSIVTIESINSVTKTEFDNSDNETVHSIISTGVILDTSGNILAAAPSIVNNDYLIVQYENKRIPARIIGIDYKTGVALLNVGKKVGEPVRIANKYGCAGQMVVALGNSYGIKASPSIGFCAGLRPDGNLQFTSTISSGTIGGGLFDLSGNLVGLITGGIGEARCSNVGLAVPSRKLKEIVYHLSKFGDRQAGYIGITSADIEFTPGIEITFPVQFARDTQQRNQIVNKGIMITDVVKLSPAANAGLRRGDLLISMNGLPLKSASDLRRNIRQYIPGSIIDFGFIRNNVPYIAPLQVGNVEFTSGCAFQDISGKSADNLNTDSLLNEIKILKQTLNNLESKLNNIKR